MCGREIRRVDPTDGDGTVQPVAYVTYQWEMLGEARAAFTRARRGVTLCMEGLLNGEDMGAPASLQVNNWLTLGMYEGLDRIRVLDKLGNGPVCRAYLSLSLSPISQLMVRRNGRADPLAGILQLFVRPDSQRKRYASRLLKDVCAEMDRRGAHGLVFTPVETAEFFARFGFQHATHDGFPEAVSEIQMACMLRENKNQTLLAQISRLEARAAARAGRSAQNPALASAAPSTPVLKSGAITELVEQIVVKRTAEGRLHEIEVHPPVSAASLQAASAAAREREVAVVTRQWNKAKKAKVKTVKARR